MGAIMDLIKKNPLLVPIYRLFAKASFKGSVDYWEKRYKKGGTSGDGSYGKLAEFKARVINEFIEEKGVNSVIEFGCGDGNQLTLSKYPSYLGLDVSKTAIDMCCKKFLDDNNKSFALYNPDCFHDITKFEKVDLTLSLDVIYHIVEDDNYKKYMNDLFAYSDKYVIIYSSDEDSTSSAAHVRHRKFTDYVEKNFPGFSLYQFIKNEYPQKAHLFPSDFYIYEKK